MSKTDIQNNFLLDYGWSPTPDEKAHFQRFCDGIATHEVLERVLNPDNHPAGKEGRRYRPNIATLYAMKDKIVGEMYDFQTRSGERDYFAEYDAELEGWGCLYCADGVVWDLVFTKRWSLEVTGVCKHCKDGDMEPRPEIVAKMKASNIPCLSIAGHVLMGLYVYRWKTGAEAGQEALASIVPVDPKRPNAVGAIPF